jgi:acyl-CoA thioesterase-1
MKLQRIFLLNTICFQLLIVQLSGQIVQPDSNYLSAIRAELNKPWLGNRTINIVIHGHSVPAGYWHDHEVHTLESYPNLLLKKLKAKYPFAVINIIVTAIGGENAIKGQLRFDSTVLNYKPDVLIIDYALNDRFAGLEKSRIAWEKMIGAALKKNIKVILVTPSPDQRLDIVLKDNELEQHARQINRLAIDFKIGLADPFSMFQKIKKDGGSLADYMSHVNHPNEKGHDIIATELMKWFN